MSATLKTIPLKQFSADADVASADGDRRGFVRKALGGYVVTRGGTQGGFADWQGARELAAAIKWNSVENMEGLLVEFEKNLLARGVKVHWAVDGESARQYVLKVLKETGAQRVIKSKTMTSEEIHLNDAMEKAGYEVVESDLGEYIQQLRKEPPYHFVFPSMHLKRGEIRETFEKELGGMTSDEPGYLTMTARGVMREKYLRADVGISGANFGVAETGMIAITENEGNARLSCAMPRVHIALMGIEKVIGKLSDLALLQPMLSTAGTGQLLTCYSSLYGGAKLAEEVDGPEEMHVVLLDNNRTEMLADPHLRDALRCIRCGACLNVCPIFKNVGGFTYGTTYQGPIGSVITPPLRGVGDFGHLAFASSLCGACTETCPVKIDLHHHLLYIRQKAVERGGRGLVEKLMMMGFAWGMGWPRLYRVGARIGLTVDGWVKWVWGSAVDPLGAWRKTRTLPERPEQSFTQWWKQKKEGGK